MVLVIRAWLRQRKPYKTQPAQYAPTIQTQEPRKLRRQKGPEGGTPNADTWGAALKHSSHLAQPIDSPHNAQLYKPNERIDNIQAHESIQANQIKVTALRTQY